LTVLEKKLFETLSLAGILISEAKGLVAIPISGFVRLVAIPISGFILSLRDSEVHAGYRSPILDLVPDLNAIDLARQERQFTSQRAGMVLSYLSNKGMAPISILEVVVSLSMTGFPAILYHTSSPGLKSSLSNQLLISLRKAIYKRLKNLESFE
jgi:hypothetical protein